MIRRREMGWCRLYSKGALIGFDFAASAYPAVLQAWKAGQAFIDVEDCWGDPVTIKLGEVAILLLSTPDGYQRYRADEAAERADDRARELTEP